MAQILLIEGGSRVKLSGGGMPLQGRNRHDCVEIDDRMAPSDRLYLLRKAYRLSRVRPMTVRLRGIPTETVDRMLDQTVREFGIAVHGVEYLVDSP